MPPRVRVVLSPSACVCVFTPWMPVFAASLEPQYVQDIPHLRVGVVYLTYTKGPPPQPSNDSLHDAYCKKSKTMPDFVAVKELVEQQVDSYRCSGASLVQALCIRRPLLQLQACFGKMYLNHAHGPVEAQPSCCRAASVILPSLQNLSTVKHGSFLFAYFLVQMKNLVKTVHALWL